MSTRWTRLARNASYRCILHPLPRLRTGHTIPRLFLRHQPRRRLFRKARQGFIQRSPPNQSVAETLFCVLLVRSDPTSPSAGTRRSRTRLQGRCKLRVPPHDFSSVTENFAYRLCCLARPLRLRSKRPRVLLKCLSSPSRSASTLIRLFQLLIPHRSDRPQTPSRKYRKH